MLKWQVLAWNPSCLGVINVMVEVVGNEGIL